MPFAFSTIFWSGLGAASVPIIIHLLNRRRFRMREWAAMKFLLESLKKNRRRLRMEEIILLALRCLVILMLVVAVAKFTGCSALEVLPLGWGESASVVIILEDSYSMGQHAESKILHDLAIADLARQLRSLPKSSKVAVISTAGRRDSSKLAELGTITDVDSVISHLKGRGLADTQGDLVESLKAAKVLLSGASGPKCLCILSDFRRIDIAAPDRAEELRSLFGQLSDAGVNIVAADHGRKPKDNLTVETIVIGRSDNEYEGLLLAGVGSRVRVTVRNNSPRPASKVKVKLTAAFATDKDSSFRRIATDQTIPTIGAGGSRSCEFRAVCDRTGPAVLRAELPADELDGDNFAYLATDVRRAVRVLLVDDRKNSANAESLFLRAAIGAGGPLLSGCLPLTVTSRELADVELNDYDVVVLLNVARFPITLPKGKQGRIECRQLERLEQYVRGGGGLAIFTGGDVRYEFYNQYLYRGGKGLCPYEIDKTPRGDPKRGTEYFRMKAVDDPAARTVRGKLLRFAHLADIDATDFIRFYAFTPAKVPKTLGPADQRQAPSPRPTILARFDDPVSSPAIVYRPFGEGKVLMYYTSANRRWNDWPVSGADKYYLPAMNDMVRFLVRAPEPSLNGLAGAPLTIPVPRRLRGAEARLAGLVDRADEISRSWKDLGGRLRCEDTWRAQGYEISFSRPGRPTESACFARNPDPLEGQLEPAGKSALDGLIRGEYEYVARRDDTELEALWTGPEREYWKWALAAMLVFLACETCLSQKLGHYA
ncbi:MAG: BatA domain-containing protein [Planctomycetota bacterium]|jgi:hypothetical protein